jgi:hypothetical protein
MVPSRCNFPNGSKPTLNLAGRTLQRPLWVLCHQSGRGEPSAAAAGARTQPAGAAISLGSCRRAPRCVSSRTTRRCPPATCRASWTRHASKRDAARALEFTILTAPRDR